MVDKNVFTQELKKVFTILKEIKIVEKYVKELIDNNNLNEETLNQYKRDLDYLDEIVNHLQDSINQTDINVQDLVQYIDSIKDFINQYENTTEIGGNLEVDGTLQVNSNISTEDMSISGELTLPSTSNLIFEDGSTFGGGGSGKYLHTVVIQSENSTSVDYYVYLSFTYISDNNRTFGQYFDDFLEDLYRLGYTGNKYLAASGCYIKKDKSNFVIIAGVNSSNSLGSSISYKGCNFNLTPITYEENTLYCIASTFYVTRSIPQTNLEIVSHDIIEL